MVCAKHNVPTVKVDKSTHARRKTLFIIYKEMKSDVSVTAKFTKIINFCKYKSSGGYLPFKFGRNSATMPAKGVNVHALNTASIP